MDFKLVMEKLLAAFDGQTVRYALIGGFALGLWGVGRATIDLDFLVDRDDMAKVDAIMKRLGYGLRYGTENVSQYVSPLSTFGEVDFLHAFREASLKMLEGAEEKAIFGGALKAKVLRPEGLVGLKLQAIRNDPSRRQGELEDIRSLLGSLGEKADWPLVEEYAKVLEMEDILVEIRKKSA